MVVYENDSCLEKITIEVKIYDCPVCGMRGIFNEDEFCRHCGEEIIWKIK